MNQTENSGRFAPVDIFADLKVTFVAGTIEIKADGNKVFIRLPSLRAALILLTLTDGKSSFADIAKAFDQALKRVDVTLFWQNHHFAILGSKAKPYFLKILIGLQQFIGFSALNVKRRRRAR